MWPPGNPGAPTQVEALRHSATNNGGRRRRERELEVPVQVQVARRDNAGDRVLLDEADGEEPGGRERKMRTWNILECMGDGFQRAPSYGTRWEHKHMLLWISQGPNIDPARHSRDRIRPTSDTRSCRLCPHNPIPHRLAEPPAALSKVCVKESGN